MQEIMDVKDIAFPHLGLYLRNVPQTLMIGNFSIALYGILVASAMLLGLVMAAHIAKKTGWDPDIIWDISIWIIVFAIVGARIYYVIFFWDYYSQNLLQIFNLRGGGLAIYGGVIACVTMIIIYCRVKKVNPLRLLDCCVFGLVLGQIIGRWGNFFNREVFGEYTDSLLAMRLPVEAVRARDISESIAAHIAEGTNYIQVHPTFLYEGLWNTALLLIMLLLLKHRRFNGEMSFLYFFGYGLGRAWIEFIRTDQLYFEGTKIPVSMVLSIVLMAASAILEIVCFRMWKAGKIPGVSPQDAAPVEKTEEKVDSGT